MNFLAAALSALCGVCRKASMVDNMMSMMESYTNSLEDIVAERTEQLQEEKRKTDDLLYRMLPK